MVASKRWLPKSLRLGEGSHEVVVYTTSDHPDKVEEADGVRIKHIFNPERTLGPRANSSTTYSAS